MENFNFTDHINLLVVTSIFISVALTSVLTVIIYAIKFRKYQKHRVALEIELEKNKKGLELTRSSLSALEVLNSTRLHEIENQKKEITKIQYKAKNQKNQIESLSKDLKLAKERATNIEQEKLKLLSDVKSLNERLLQADEDIDAVRKRNEFWVAQVSELRVKYDALKLKQG